MKTWKKRIFSPCTLIGLVTIIAFGFGFAGCNDGNGSPIHTHDFGTIWKSNTTQHWHECSCGEKADIANHTWDWQETTPATTEAEGSETETCKICHSRFLEFTGITSSLSHDSLSLGLSRA
jgi:peptidoglycan/xylan/chitin deacetylase (PgdA/CDA1 family)